MSVRDLSPWYPLAPGVHRGPIRDAPLEKEGAHYLDMFAKSLRFKQAQTRPMRDERRGLTHVYQLLSETSCRSPVQTGTYFLRTQAFFPWPVYPYTPAPMARYR